MTSPSDAYSQIAVYVVFHSSYYWNKSMTNDIPVKKSFGSLKVARFSPPLPAADSGKPLPKALNMHVSFEEAMRLYLGLGQALAKLNSYDRSTKAGRESAVNLCVFLDNHRITINECKVTAPKSGNNQNES